MGVAVLDTYCKRPNEQQKARDFSVGAEHLCPLCGIGAMLIVGRINCEYLGAGVLVYLAHTKVPPPPRTTVGGRRSPVDGH